MRTTPFSAGRRAFLILMALTALTFSLAGCGGGSSPGTGGQNGKTTVTGIVLDAAQGDLGVGGATITIGGVTTTTTTVNSASASNPVGSFTLQNVPVGTSTATITAPGFAAQTIAFSPAVAAGTNAALELVINIGQVSGRILLANGQPANGAFVSVVSSGDSVTTGANGVFLLPNIPLGPTQITAVLGTASVTRDITVIKGDTALGDLTLADDPNPNPPGLPTTIIGTVTLAGSGPAPNTPVLLFRNGGQIEQANTDASGNYSFYVPVGTYTVVSTRPTFQNATSAPFTVTNPSVPVRVDLTLNPQ